MFKLNGDIIRQLNSIYAFSFNRKYKKELKEKILFFLNYKLQNYMTSNFQETLASVNNIVLIENNQIVSIYMYFINNNQAELLTYFNPLWYNQNSNIKIKYLKKEMNYIFDTFLYEEYILLKKDFLSHKCFFSSPDELLETTNLYSKVNNINYTKDLYQKFISKTNHSIFSLLNNRYFLKSNELRGLKSFFSYLEDTFDHAIKFDNEDKKELLLRLQPFISYKYKIHQYSDFYSYIEVFDLLSKIYYLIKIQKNVKSYID